MSEVLNLSKIYQITSERILSERLNSLQIFQQAMSERYFNNMITSF